MGLTRKYSHKKQGGDLNTRKNTPNFKLFQNNLNKIYQLQPSNKNLKLSSFVSFFSRKGIGPNMIRWKIKGLDSESLGIELKVNKNKTQMLSRLQRLGSVLMTQLTSMKESNTQSSEKLESCQIRFKQKHGGSQKLPTIDTIKKRIQYYQ